MADCGCNHFPASGGNVTFDTNVLVGIGTGSPASVLHVFSGGAYPTFLMQGSDSASGVNGLTIEANGRTYTLFVGGSANPGLPNTFALYDATAGVFRVAVTPAGNVGVGTTTPGARLDVSSAGVGTQFQLENPNLAGNIWGLTPGDGGIGGQALYLYRFRSGSTAGLGGGPDEALMQFVDDGTTRQSHFCTPNGTSVVTVDNTTGALQLTTSLTLTRTDVSSTYTKLLVDQNDLHLTSTATSDGTPSGTRGTIALQTNPFGDGILQVGTAPNTGAFLVYQAGAQVLGLGRNQFNINTNDANGVNYQYLTLDGNGLHLAATNPGAHNATISLNTNTFGDAILNLGTGPGTGALLVYQAGAQVLGVGRQQFGVYTVDGNGVDYVYLNLDGNGLHLAATNPGFHGSTITLNTNTFGDAILSVGTGPGVGDLIVQQSGTQILSVGGGGNLALAGRTVANGNGCFYA